MKLDRSCLDVLVIGAGFGGIATAIRLKAEGTSNFRVYEKAPAVGGTWWHNTYPGAACDIASHLYCYSFEPNPNWSRKFSPQAEIQAYIEHCTDKYQVRDHIQLNTGVDGLYFQDDSQCWQARLSNGERVLARHVVVCTGGLHIPAYPDIPGRESFAGPAMHSATWDHSVDFNGKHVAVIGSAASAIQLIPELAKSAAQVDIYQRTPNYIAPRGDREFTDKEKARFARWPLWHRLYRKWIFLRGEYVLFPVVKKKTRSRWRDSVEAYIKRHIKSSIKDARTRKLMVPDYPLGCKRILIADNFYDALNRNNVTVIPEGISSVDSNGINCVDGQHHPADIIVYATGFDVDQQMYATEIIGPNGLVLNVVWAEKPTAYKGAFVPGFPNLHLMSGPNTGVGHSSVVYLIEAQLEMIMQALKACGDDKLIRVTEAANEDYNRGLREALQQSVWAGDCKSWYKREDGEIVTLYPHDARTFRRERKQLRPSDFDIYPRARSAGE